MNRFFHTALAALSIALPFAAHASFRDVTKDDPYSESILELQAKGILHGYPDGTFKPYVTINRAEFVKILEGLGSGAAPYPNPALRFSDYDPHAWYATFVSAAVGDGLIKGYPDGTLRLQNPINFAEAAVMFSNFFDTLNTFCTGPEPLAGKDGCPINPSHPWYEWAVRSLAFRQAIPTSIGSFEHLLTRGEMAEMIVRLREAGDWPSRTYEELLRTTNDQSTLAQTFGTTDHFYVVILATTRDQSAANARAKDLGAWVLPTSLTSNLAPNLYAVVRGPYNDQDEAKNQLHIAKNMHGNMLQNPYVKDAGTLLVPKGLAYFEADIPLRVLVAFAGRIQDTPLTSLTIQWMYKEHGSSPCDPQSSFYSFVALRDGKELVDALSPSQFKALEGMYEGLNDTFRRTMPIRFYLPIHTGDIVAEQLCMD